VRATNVCATSGMTRRSLVKAWKNCLAEPAAGAIAPEAQSHASCATSPNFSLQPAKSGRGRDEPAHGWVWDWSSSRAWAV
jgi:hypothetical protein